MLNCIITGKEPLLHHLSNDGIMAPESHHKASSGILVPSCGHFDSNTFKITLGVHLTEWAFCSVKSLLKKKAAIWNQRKVTSYHVLCVGAVQPVLQWNRCDVCLHPKLFWLLHWRKHQQRRHRVSPDSQWDNLRLWQRESQQCFLQTPWSY